MSTMSHSPSVGQIVLHVWPGHQTALSFDPHCVAALLHLQLAIPGQFAVEYCTNPDVSPSGQLPFLSHGLHRASSLPAITHYVNNLGGARDLDSPLGSSEKAQFTARVAHVQSEYGNLVAHMMYSLHENWTKSTHPALANMLPVPQRYYVPHRLREAHKPRLELVELWDVPGIEYVQDEDDHFSFRRIKRKKKETLGEKYKRTFEREKVQEKARAFFDSYAKLLAEKPLFANSDSPSTLDIVFAAHTHLLLSLPFSDPLLQTVLKDGYPALVLHMSTVLAVAMPQSHPLPAPIRQDMNFTLSSLITWPRYGTRAAEELSPAGEEARKYRNMRWAFFGLSAAVTAGYLLFEIGLLRIVQEVAARLEVEEVEGAEFLEELDEDEDVPVDASDAQT